MQRSEEKMKEIKRFSSSSSHLILMLPNILMINNQHSASLHENEQNRNENEMKSYPEKGNEQFDDGFFEIHFKMNISYFFDEIINDYNYERFMCLRIH